MHAYGIYLMYINMAKHGTRPTSGTKLFFVDVWVLGGRLVKSQNVAGDGQAWTYTGKSVSYCLSLKEKRV